MKPDTRHRIVRAHRRLGLLATIPLVGWVASSFVLHGVALALPENGLQGEYTLNPWPETELRLETAGVAPPSSALAWAEADGLERVYWLRLQAMAGSFVYVAKPGPFDLERVYDARTGARLDPLPPDFLERIASATLVDTRPVHGEHTPEFNRYYTVDRVPAVSFRMAGAQPSEIVLSNASGRTLRRTDPLAAAFQKAYRSVHIWQWGDSLRLFTSLLYGLVGLTLVLVTLGYTLWFERRRRGRPLPPGTRRARRVHRMFAPFAGVVLVTQMLVGAYLWYNLGLIEPRFRGQGSFQREWTGGIATDEWLEPVDVVSRSVPDAHRLDAPPVQAYEWRAAGDRRIWVAYPRLDEEGIVIDAATGESLERLPVDVVREAAQGVVLGQAIEFKGESTEYWMDFNRRVPTYLFRFDDPDESDVHVSQRTGEVVQRRPAIWRGFGPFLTYHTFGFTGNAFLDTVLLTTLQLTILVMIVTGWRMARPFRRSTSAETAAGREPEPVDATA